MQVHGYSVNYVQVADRLERAAQILRDDPANRDRSVRLAKLAEQIRDEQRLPPGLLLDDEV